jgi:hypothetical protein
LSRPLQRVVTTDVLHRSNGRRRRHKHRWFRPDPWTSGTTRYAWTACRRQRGTSLAQRDRYVSARLLGASNPAARWKQTRRAGLPMGSYGSGPSAVSGSDARGIRWGVSERSRRCARRRWCWGRILAG